jgi:hypothetical protein
MLESKEMSGDGPEMGKHNGKDTSLIRARYTVRLAAEIVDHLIRPLGSVYIFSSPRGIVALHQPYPRLQRAALSGVRLATRIKSCSHESLTSSTKAYQNCRDFLDRLTAKRCAGSLIQLFRVDRKSPSSGTAVVVCLIENGHTTLSISM